MSLRNASIPCGVIGGAFLSAMSALAADLSAAPYGTAQMQAPAVDGFNTKIDGFGGSVANKSIYGSAGSLAVPLGGQYGAQIDGAVGNLDSRLFGNIGGHLFWRNPAIGLIGIYGDYTRWDSPIGGLNVGRVAGEGEYYLGRWTLGGLVGVETGNSVTGVIGTSVVGGAFVSNTQTFDVGTRFTDAVDLAYYLQDNLKLFAGHRYQGGKNTLALGGELGFSVNQGTMGALFVEGRLGGGDNHGVWGGLRFYFGQHDKSLIRRNREDDPVGNPTGALFGLAEIIQSGHGAMTPTGGCIPGWFFDPSIGTCSPNF